MKLGLGPATALLCALAACPSPSPVVPPQPDAADAAGTPVCVAACGHLAALGCPEGHAADCASVLASIERDHLVRMSDGTPQTCLSVELAPTVAAERLLGVGCRP